MTRGEDKEGKEKVEMKKQGGGRNGRGGGNGMGGGKGSKEKNGG